LFVLNEFNLINGALKFFQGAVSCLLPWSFARLVCRDTRWPSGFGVRASPGWWWLLRHALRQYRQGTSDTVFSDHTPLLTGWYVHHTHWGFESSRGAERRSEERTEFRTNAYPFVYPNGIPFGLFSLFLEVLVYRLPHHVRQGDVLARVFNAIFQALEAGQLVIIKLKTVPAGLSFDRRVFRLTGNKTERFSVRCSVRISERSEFRSVVWSSGWDGDGFSEMNTSCTSGWIAGFSIRGRVDRSILSGLMREGLSAE